MLTDKCGAAGMVEIRAAKGGLVRSLPVPTNNCKENSQKRRGPLHLLTCLNFSLQGRLATSTGGKPQPTPGLERKNGGTDSFPESCARPSCRESRMRVRIRVNSPSIPSRPHVRCGAVEGVSNVHNFVADKRRASSLSLLGLGAGIKPLAIIRAGFDAGSRVRWAAALASVRL